MIVGYRDKRPWDFAAGKRVKAFSGIARTGRSKLDRLEAATALKDLGALPGNRFEALAGDRGSTASASMINGGSVLNGRMAPRGRRMSRFLITTRSSIWQ
jgi:plasmid maintenance system killer protein